MDRKQLAIASCGCPQGCGHPLPVCAVEAQAGFFIFVKTPSPAPACAHRASLHDSYLCLDAQRTTLYLDYHI